MRRRRSSGEAATSAKSVRGNFGNRQRQKNSTLLSSTRCSALLASCPPPARPQSHSTLYRHLAHDHLRLGAMHSKCHASPALPLYSVDSRALTGHLPAARHVCGPESLLDRSYLLRTAFVADRCLLWSPIAFRVHRTSIFRGSGCLSCWDFPLESIRASLVSRAPAPRRKIPLVIGSGDGYVRLFIPT